jgi:MinD-like ATPase involved in chromosome partitioning or flagellar assembly
VYVTRVISLHSFRGGTGKSNITANTAAYLAQTGRRVGVIDTDIQSPGIHAIFQLAERRIKHTLNDYLWGQCPIEEATFDVTPPELTHSSGRIFLTPSSMNAGDISRVLHEAYDVRQLKDGFKDLIRALDLDYLLIDTHPGLNEETLLSIAISHVLVVILRPDAQDFQGTGVTLEVAQKLGVPQMILVLNKVLLESDDDTEIAQVFAGYRRQLRETYGHEAGAILPLASELVRLASSGLFILQAPHHLFSQGLRALGDKIIGAETR